MLDLSLCQIPLPRIDGTAFLVRLFRMDKILKGWKWFRLHCLPATKHDLKMSDERIMKAIQDFATAANTSLTSIESSVAAITANQGALSADDQAALAGVQNRIAAVDTNLKSLVSTPAVPTGTPPA